MAAKSQSRQRSWLRENWYRDVWLFGITVLVLLALKSGQDTNGQVARNQQANTRALCSFRDDLQRRVQSTDDFLATHPKGIPGIPVGTIRISLINEQRTLDALSPLICSSVATGRSVTGHARAHRH